MYHFLPIPNKNNDIRIWVAKMALIIKNVAQILQRSYELEVDESQFQWARNFRLERNWPNATAILKTYIYSFDRDIQTSTMFF